MEGWTEGRTERRTEGRMEGLVEGQTEGRTEGLTEGRAKGGIERGGTEKRKGGQRYGGTLSFFAPYLRREPFSKKDFEWLCYSSSINLRMIFAHPVNNMIRENHIFEIPSLLYL